MRSASTFNSGGFNPRTYIRYDASERLTFASVSRFNPRTYIRYDINVAKIINRYTSFNPRTYIRYDALGAKILGYDIVSIHVPI